ncbi:hypothetical protein A8A01_14710 [Ewingella americana]|nr:hypothetical protein A8A01_14710 [Ewingella americana]
MKVNSVVVSALLIVFSSCAVAAERYVDPIQKNIDEKHSLLVQKYKKTCKAKNRISCEFEAKDHAEEDIPSRGSLSYSKKTYAGYSSAQAKSKLKELVSLYDRIDGQSKSSWDGKMTPTRIESEIRWLMVNKLGFGTGDVIQAKMYLGLPV